MKQCEGLCQISVSEDHMSNKRNTCSYEKAVRSNAGSEWKDGHLKRGECGLQLWLDERRLSACVSTMDAELLDQTASLFVFGKAYHLAGTTDVKATTHVEE